MGIGTRAASGSIVRQRRGVVAAAALGAGLLIGGLGSAIAQDANGTPEAGRGGRNAPHPAHIHSGSCGEGELGDVVAPLSDLVAPRGQGAGNENATTAATSFTTVPLPLAAILGADHAVNVHLSADQIDTYIACGELGGPVNDDGSLVVGLREVDNSRFFGIAFLSPGADGASTNVSVFVAEDRAGRGGGGRNAEGTPTAGGIGGGGLDLGTPSADEREAYGTPEAGA